jgi:trans-2,3-dihydro-3-hydroxyanthranilate isomerase
MHDYVVADVFTDAPLQGNPVAVFLDGSGLRGEEMQAVAREMNLSETVFVTEDATNGGAGSPDFDAAVRIFTPAAELPFAGHPVLGTAVILGERSDAGLVRLRTGVGVIPVSLTRVDGGAVSGEMEQPVPTAEAFGPVEALLAALGVAKPDLPVEVYENGARHVCIGLGSEAEVAALTPDIRALASLGAFGFSCFAGAGTRYKTRMFGPGLGVPEDPATGSAAGPIAVHLVRHGRVDYGTEIELRQGEEIRRPSRLRAVVEGEGERITRVAVAGSAVVVARGQYRLR